VTTQFEKEDNQKLQVALLMDDIAEAKVISDTLRDMGIFAHYYSELDEYWVAANTQSPDLTIVDVKKMSQGTLLFKNHQKVMNNNLCYSFYYKEDTTLLLNSTYGLKHYGYIKKEINFAGQIQAVLDKRNNELKLIDQNIQLAERVDRLQKRSQRVITDAQLSINFENQYQLLLDLVDRVGTIGAHDSFAKRISNVFSEWDACSNYGIYELNLNGQKLISPDMIKPKYKSFPDLWLSEACHSGMEDYAIEMAEEISLDAFAKHTRVLKINGADDKPDMIILGSFFEDRLHDFQWNMLEERLSNIYRKQKLAMAKSSAQSSRDMSIWDSFSYLDDIQFHQAKSNHKLVSLDFSSLLNMIKERHSNRFYWKSFYNDFSEELGMFLSGNYKQTNFGVQNILLFLDKNLIDVEFQKIKAFVADFQYYRYFEDSSILMSNEIIPNVKLIAPSSVNFMRQLHSDIVTSGSQSAPKRRKPVWEENSATL